MRTISTILRWAATTTALRTRSKACRRDSKCIKLHWKPVLGCWISRLKTIKEMLRQSKPAIIRMKYYGLISMRMLVIYILSSHQLSHHWRNSLLRVQPQSITTTTRTNPHQQYLTSNQSYSKANSLTIDSHTQSLRKRMRTSTPQRSSLISSTKTRSPPLSLPLAANHETVKCLNKASKEETASTIGSSQSLLQANPQNKTENRATPRGNPTWTKLGLWTSLKSKLMPWTMRSKTWLRHSSRDWSRGWTKRRNNRINRRNSLRRSCLNVRKSFSGMPDRI